MAEFCSSRQIMLFWFCAVLGQKQTKEGLVGEFCSSRQIMLFWFCAVIGQKQMKEGLEGEFCSSRQIMLFWFCAAVGRETAEKQVYESGTRFSLRSNLVVSPPREHQVLCSFWPNLTKSAFWQTRYTDSVLASLEPRLFHSKLLLGFFWQFTSSKDL